jgi:hypothetical protein
LEAQKKLSIEIELSKDVVFPFIKMIQHDTNILEFVVKENGEDADLSKIGRIVVYYRRPDKEEIPRFLKANGNKINYKIGYQEMKLFGEGQIELQFYSLDNLSRVSTKRFKIYLSGSSGTDLVIESDKDLTLLQELFVEVSDLKTLAAQSTDIVESEVVRKSNEGQRETNETTRMDNESLRISAEAQRITEENERVNQEATRRQSETNREEKEDIREENEETRLTAESTRINNESNRQNEESERITKESTRQSAENTRLENEIIRQNNETNRVDKENERREAETIRKNNENIRIEKEQARQSNEETREQQEAARQVTIQQAVIATENTNAVAVEAAINSAYAKEQAEKAKEAAETAKTYWLNPVTNFSDIVTTYPNALDGSQVITTIDQKQYRRINGAWTWTGVNSANGLAELQAKFNDANMQIQTLSNGTSILTSALNSPILIEVQGRTLTSLGNSNLEGGKLYVLADKRTKIRAEGREGTLLNGVAKFTKSASLITKADFVGKVSGSVAENAHIVKYRTTSTLDAPSSFVTEFSNANYSNISTLNGTSQPTNGTSNGNIAQHLASFNIIEQIERKLGRIPSDTVAGKVQWIKDNVQRFKANWYGWGSSVGGNGASFVRWNTSLNSGVGGWNTTINTNTSGSPSLISYETIGVANLIDSNGIAHYLAYTTQPSDGTTPSQLNTDFIELEIELKSTAVLDTKPIITRTATFEGKVSGSTVENPHFYKNTASNVLVAPSGNFIEITQNRYDSIRTLDNNYVTNVNSINGFMLQQLFSFNLIEEVERNIGRIPKATVAEKRQWIIDNVERLTYSWSGFGSSVGGNKATVSWWRAISSIYDSAKSHGTGSVATLTDFQINLNNYIDSNGMVHLLANAEPSDGTTPSTINTDFISLDITLKQGATLHDPVLPLFEVDATDYANILVSWDENAVMSRFPKVQGVQHLQNPAVIAEGENLLPSFYEWILHTTATAKSPYELELNAISTTNQFSYVLLDVIPNQVITYGFEGEFASDNAAFMSITDVNQTIQYSFMRVTEKSKTFIIPSGVNRIRVRLHNEGVVGKYTFRRPMLTLGNVSKPFVPRNPSYLFAQTKLGQIGTVKDSLFKNDGNWQLVERVRKDVVLDGTLVWNDSANYTGFKRASVLGVAPNSSNGHSSNMLATKYDGTKTEVGATWGDRDLIRIEIGNVYVVVKNTDSGFGETYRPLPDEWKAYFNGWQAKTTDGNGKPTAWRSLGDGTDAPTQTLAYVSTNKAPNFTPYKLSYVLANPQTVNVNHLVEGDIVVSGQTQVEVTSGVVVREKVTPQLAGGFYRINDTNAPISKLTQKNEKFLTIFRGGLKDSRWIIDGAAPHGKQRAYIAQSDFDTTVDYHVTYLVLDRHLHTVNATEVKASYSGSLKDTVDMNNEKLSDVATQTSINTNLIYRLLLQAKANNWSV